MSDGAGRQLPSGGSARPRSEASFFARVLGALFVVACAYAALTPEVWKRQLVGLLLLVACLGALAFSLVEFRQLVVILLVGACVFASVSVADELWIWREALPRYLQMTEEQMAFSILGDIAPFFAGAARVIPEGARVLLATNESPDWRGRYLLLPRAVCPYHGPLPEGGNVREHFLVGERELLEKLDIDWVVYYERTTTGLYRIVSSAIFPVPTGSGERRGSL